MTTSDTATTGAKSHRERKYPQGERGFHAGEYPKHGPFLVLVKVKQDAPAETAARPGRGQKYYHAARIARRTEPPEGFTGWLITHCGPGWYRVVEEANQTARGAHFCITPGMAARYTPDKPADNPTPPPIQPNPPPNLVEAALEQAKQMEALRRALAPPTPAPPAIPPQLVTPLVQWLASNLLAPQPQPAPAPNPPPTPEWAQVVAELRGAGLSAADTLAILRASRPAAPTPPQPSQTPPPTQASEAGDDDEAGDEYDDEAGDEYEDEAGDEYEDEAGDEYEDEAGDEEAGDEYEQGELFERR